MSITVNGKTVEHVNEETVAELLKRMHYTFPLIIVKINGKLVKKEEYRKILIPDNAVFFFLH
jgi:thiazole synthase/sulfur carrier protein